MIIPEDLYKQIIQLMPIICVDVLIEHNNKYLIIKRNDEPAKGEWWLVGGRLHKNESLENCVIRKCKEEVGLDVEIIKQLTIKETQFKTGPFHIPIHSINIIYHVTTNSPHITMDSTMTDYQWINKDSNINQYIKDILKCVKN